MKHEFRVANTPIEGGWILAQVPELPGAVTQGQTMDEARATIEEAVELLLQSYRKNAQRDAPGDTMRKTLLVNGALS